MAIAAQAGVVPGAAGDWYVHDILFLLGLQREREMDGMDGMGWDGMGWVDGRTDGRTDRQTDR